MNVFQVWRAYKEIEWSSAFYPEAWYTLIREMVWKDVWSMGTKKYEVWVWKGSIFLVKKIILWIPQYHTVHGKHCQITFVITLTSKQNRWISLLCDNPHHIYIRQIHSLFNSDKGICPEYTIMYTDNFHPIKLWSLQISDYS